MLSTGNLPQKERHRQTESKGMEKYFIQVKNTGEAILVSDNIEFKTKAVIRNKEGHSIILKGSIQQQDITLVNIYTPNIEARKSIKQS